MKIVIFVILGCCLFITKGDANIWCGYGVPVLVRQKKEDGNFNIFFKCLCPADYFGKQCKYHKELSCFIKTQNQSISRIDKSNFQKYVKLHVQVSLNCYIAIKGQLTPLNRYLLEGSIKPSLETQEDTILDNIQIIWANKSELFDQYGQVKYQQGFEYRLDESGRKKLSKQDELKIISGPGPYQFKYSSYFIGFPLTQSKFILTPTLVYPMKNSKKLPPTDFNFLNVTEYLNQVNKSLGNQTQKFQKEMEEYIEQSESSDRIKEYFRKIFQNNNQIQIPNLVTSTILPKMNFSMTVNPQDDTQFEMIRGQIDLVEYYGFQFMYTHQTSLNSANIRIVVDYPNVGKPIVYNKNFVQSSSPWISILGYLFLALVVLLAIYIAKRYKINVWRSLCSKFQQRFKKIQPDELVEQEKSYSDM